eukprot:scaffold731_cov261-Pinguiococcus_pyrenoidosus.AAC.14
MLPNAVAVAVAVAVALFERQVARLGQTPNAKCQMPKRFCQTLKSYGIPNWKRDISAPDLNFSCEELAELKL